MKVRTYKIYKCGICGREFNTKWQCEECEARCSSETTYVRYRLRLVMYNDGHFATDFNEVGDLIHDGTLRCGPSRVCSFAPESLYFEYLKRKDDPKPASQVLEETLVYAKEWLGKFTKTVSSELKKLLKGGKDAESN